VGELGVAEGATNELSEDGVDFEEGVGVTAFATSARTKAARANGRVFIGELLSWGF
jgi:hypothetical protein